MTIQELLRKLPELSQADLDKVQLRLQLLRGKGKSITASSRTGEDWLTDGFCGELRRRGLLVGRQHPGLFPKDWENRAAPVREYLLKGTPRKLNGAERLVLASIAAEQLIAYFERFNIKVSPKMLFTNVGKVPQAMEASFPGYWGSGVLHFCVRKRSAS
jgi:hypothetical protein